MATSASYSTRQAQNVAGDAARNAVVVLVTVRAHMLLFSAPYMWLWSEGLHVVSRASLIVAHGTALLAIANLSTTSDLSRGMIPRLGLMGGSRWSRPDLAKALIPIFPLLSLAALAALLTSPTELAMPAVIAVMLVGGLLWARTAPAKKYLAWPEWGGPLLVMLLPAGVLAFGSAATPPPASVIAGSAFMVALTLATHLRDRGDDLRGDVPTAATRRPHEARAWMWMAAVTGSLAVLTGIYTPLGIADLAGMAGALGVLAGAALFKVRVGVMTAAHGLIGFHWFFA